MTAASILATDLAAIFRQAGDAFEAFAAAVEEPEPEPEPPVHPIWMHVGAGIQRQPGETMQQAITRFNQRVTGNIGVHRAFSRSWELWPDHDASANDGTKRVVVMSVKGDGNFVELVASIPEGREVYLIAPPHEIDRPDRGISGADFRRTCDRLLDAIEVVGNPLVYPAICVTGYREHDNNPAPGYETSARWFPVDCEPWTLLIDPYDVRGRVTLEERTSPTVELWRQHGGSRWGIAEVSSHRTGSDLAMWIEDGFHWAKNDGCEVMCWFDSNVGGAAGSTGWYLLDPDGIAEYREWLR